MAASIQLLGVPRFILQDGTPVVLRGQTAWGLLAYLATHEGPVTRQHLARLLFEDAEDPLAALRWNLTELRRGLGSASLRGETIALNRGVDSIIDVNVLRRGGRSTRRGLAGYRPRVVGRLELRQQSFLRGLVAGRTTPHASHGPGRVARGDLVSTGKRCRCRGG
jgi:DNA-binding SARP family transcriptional activator